MRGFNIMITVVVDQYRSGSLIARKGFRTGRVGPVRNSWLKLEKKTGFDVSKCLYLRFKIQFKRL